MSQRGIFITFEGSEGCGKSTQISLLAEWLRGAGREVVLVREPGGTPSGEQIRHLLQHAPEGENLTPEAELLLFAASRAQLVREIIEPALAAGHAVISDRFLDSTTVYQGVARRIPSDATASINAFAVGTCLPDVTFLLDLDPEVAASRIGNREKDRIEREPASFFQAVREGYLAVAASNRDRIRIIDASREPGAVAEDIRNATARLLG